MGPKITNLDIAKIIFESDRVIFNAMNGASRQRWSNQANIEHNDQLIKFVSESLRRGYIDPKTMHDEWCTKKIDEGWTYGLKYSTERKTEPLLVNYSELPTYIKVQDELKVFIVNYFANLRRNKVT